MAQLEESQNHTCTFKHIIDVDQPRWFHTMEVNLPTSLLALRLKIRHGCSHITLRCLHIIGCVVPYGKFYEGVSICAFAYVFIVCHSMAHVQLCKYIFKNYYTNSDKTLYDADHVLNLL